MTPTDGRSAPSAPLDPPAPPASAVRLLGDRLPSMVRYVAHLADTGVSHGLIGPREVPRLWERHVLNCAVAGEVIAPDATVIDIGSGAGLPGVVLAIARPDLRLTLVEPLLRRVTWLERVCTDLALPNVDIVRGRAEEQWGRLRADVVTARAVAALDRLAGWGLPLVEDGGQLIALKGASAHDELDEVREAVSDWGVIQADIVSCGDGVVDPPTLVTRLTLADHPAPGTLARPVDRDGSRAGTKDGRPAGKRSAGRGPRRDRARGRR